DFDELAPSLYDEEDAARGFVEVEDRRNARHEVPLMGISLGVASTEHRTLASVAESSTVATEMKLLAKAEDSSAFRIDKRHT
ncbi:MAG: diguanylate cyclase response regulator, partial [Acidimicrobiales bacterium]